MYPERNGDGIARKINGGIGAGTIVKREADYCAPVTAHFGYNNIAQYGAQNPSDLIGGCTLEKPEKIVFIDELDEEDNCNVRMSEVKEFAQPGAKLIRPEMEWLADGTVMLTMFFPAEKGIAEAAAIECGRRMGLTDVEVISREIGHRAEGTRIEIKGKVPFSIEIDKLVIPKEPDVLSDDEIRADIERRPMKVVCGTVGEDEHSVGLREIIDIKHGGIEKYGIEVHYLGTSVPPEKLVNAAIELNADAMLASTIISHDDIHYKNIAKINRIATEMGVRDKLIFVAGGTQVASAQARANGADEGFGRGSHGNHVATFLVKRRREMENN
jgi:D-ornithine 4,5-aminomutase subunit beta